VKVVFVTDAPYALDVRLQRTVEALGQLDGYCLAVIDQGMMCNESAKVLANWGEHYPVPVPSGGMKKYLWHAKNRLKPEASHEKRLVWIEQTLHQISPDIVHCINPFALEACMHFAKKSSARLIYEAYEYWPDYIYQLGRRVPEGLAKRLIQFEERGAQFADAAITVSEPIAQWYSFLFSDSTFTVIYNLNSPDGVEKAAATQCDEISLVYAGILHRERNIELAIGALSKCSGARLTLQGDGPDKGRLMALVKRADLEERVKFSGMVPPSDLVDSLSAFDVGLSLLPSTSKQMDGAVPNKVFDYMRAGLGILAADTEGLRSLAGVQGSFRYIDEPRVDLVAAALQELTINKESVSKMKESSRENSHYYTRASQIEKIQKLYQSLS